MEQYILLYGNKKPEDVICIKNMFENVQLLELGWTDKEYHNNMEILDKYIKEGYKEKESFYKSKSNL